MDSSEQPGRKKKTLTTTVGLIVGAGVIVLTQQLFFKAPSYDEAMVRAASAINKSCPIMIDQETRLDNVIALPGNVFQYNYTLINMEKASTDVDRLKEMLEPTIVNNVKTNPDMKINRENKTAMAFSYKDKNGEFLFKISVTPARYEN